MAFYYTNSGKRHASNFGIACQVFSPGERDQTDYKSHTAKPQLRMHTPAAPLDVVYQRLVEEAGVSQREQAGLWGSFCCVLPCLSLSGAQRYPMSPPGLSS